MYSTFLIFQRGKSIRKPNFILYIISGLSCYITIVPLILTDFFTMQFQFFYFGIYGIPKVKRKPYFVIDRHLLRQLKWRDKFNCVFCGYANGVVAWSKAVVNQMEIYSCAIKHLKTPPGQKHHTQFYPRKKFE
jgi:hypothetical protein